jgi:integrase
LLIASNTDIKTVSARLGHAQASTTLNIYAHSLQKADAACADTLEGLFNTPKTQNKAN